MPEPRRETFALTLDGEIYTGWTALRVSRGIDQLAGAFHLSVSERFGGLGAARPIRAGQAATVSLGARAVITGFVDKVAPNYDQRRHTLSVAGRDATGDLVDCAADASPGHWQNQTLAQIAADLVAPFQAGLTVATDVGPAFAHWSVEPGETVFENLDRAARYRGVLLYSDGLGNLVIGAPGTLRAPAPLVLGENIAAARGESSALQRFSDYIVRGQQQGTDQTFGAAAAQVIARAADAAVSRYRPTVIVAENETDTAGAKARAAWQRTVNAARAHQIIYTVYGWRAHGALWQPNATVHVTDKFLGLDAERLISRVAFTLDNQGARTELTVVPPAAYKPAKLPEPANPEGLY